MDGRFEKARSELEAARQELSENDPLRLKIEFTYYQQRHNTNLQEFKQRVKQKGFPQYAWDIHR